MKPAIWIFTIAFDGLFFTLMYLWQFHGHEAAGTFFIGAMWFIAALGLFAAFQQNPLPRTIAYEAYQIVSSLALILVIVYVGHVWLAACYGFVWLAMTGSRLKEKSAP